MYNTLEISVVHAVPSAMARVAAEGAGVCAMAQVATEGAGVHAMVLSEVHDAGTAHITEQADVFAVRGFEMILDPGDNDRHSGLLEVFAVQTDAQWPLLPHQTQRWQYSAAHERNCW